jgi:hypothetical protein
MKRPRFTVRNLMFITAIFAVGLFVAQELQRNHDIPRRLSISICPVTAVTNG